MGALDQFPVRGAGGGGGKGGGGSARVPTEAPDSIRSRQFVKIIDAIGEGEIGGLVDGLKSVYLDDTPVQSASGSYNFEGVTIVTRPGTVDQSYIEGFGEVQTEVAVGVEVKADAPVVRTLLNADLDAVRVTLRIPALSYQNPSNGDITGTSVTIAIDRQLAGAGWQTVVTDTIDGKTTSAYDRAYRIELPGNGPWEIRMRRLTPDSAESNRQNKTWWSSYTEIIDSKLRYPCTALVALHADAERFDSIPTRGYDMYGRCDLLIPSNYDPYARTYSGIWDGTFKPGWTENPAWVFYDVVVNDRVGLGAWLGESAINKWTLYEIGRYCDELVPDGFGGMEPRFSVFLYKQDRQEAFTVLSALASIMRAVTYWGGGEIVPVQDRPSDAFAQFTAANIEGGEFLYGGTDGETRYTVALVTYNEPADGYRQAIEYVPDPEGIARYGVVETEVVAVGCKSRSQAHRFGKWLLYSSRMETETLSFRAGLDAAKVYPGAIIKTLDPYRAGKRRGGRLVAATTSVLTLDAPVTLESGLSYSISVVLPSGAVQDRPVLWGGAAAQEVTEVQLAMPLDAVPVPFAIWVMAGSDLQPELWRVLSVGEPDEGNKVDISAVSHRPDKFATVENDLALEPLPTTSISTTPGPVTGLVATTAMRILPGAAATARLLVSWTPPVAGAVRYLIDWQRGSDTVRSTMSLYPSCDIDDVPAGEYTIWVTPVNALGRRGSISSIAHVVDASGVAPDVQGLRFDPAWSGRDCAIAWDAVPGAHTYHVRVFSGATLLREEWPTVAAYTYTYARNVADGGPRRSLRFEVIAHTAVGHSANAAVLAASNPAPAAPAGLMAEPGPGQVGISAIRPTDDDLTGMIVWMHTSAAVPTTDAYKIYQGGDNAYMQTGLQPGITMYFKVAFFDAFGTSGLNVSNSIAATPTATGGIMKVAALPANPAAVGGELAVFLDIEDPSVRGLYGWDGTSWKYTRDGSYLVAKSVAADKLAVSQLSAISANLGTMTAGSFTLDATGWIRGGAASWVTGKGIWQGYHDGNYKWRVGTPGAAGASWDGVKFTIYDADGNVTIQSGSSIAADWNTLLNKPKESRLFTNLLDTTPWTQGRWGDSLAGNGWAINGGPLENYIYTDPAGPGGGAVAVWYCYAGRPEPGGTGLPVDPPGNGDGGWNVFDIEVIPEVTYRYTVWFKVINTPGNTAQVYHGPQPGKVKMIGGDGSPVGNPYFFFTNTKNLVVGEWYLLVGYIYPRNWIVAPSPASSGLYNALGEKIANGQDYSWLNSTTFLGGVRSYQFYADQGNIVQFADPLFVPCQGSEPSLSELLAPAISARASAAQTAANTAQTAANTANALLADIAADAKLTPVEKKDVRKEMDEINGEKAGINAEASRFSITTENTAYNNAFTTLAIYTTPLLSNLNTTSDIVASTFRSNFTTFYNARQALLNAIAAKAKTLADNAQTAANDAATAASTAQSSANTANALLADIAADAKLTPVEKKSVNLEWQALVGEKSGINAQAASFGITTENTAYNTAYSTLGTYVTPLLSNLNATSDIVAGTFRLNFVNFYNARQVLLNKIAELSASMANVVEGSVTSIKYPQGGALTINTGAVTGIMKITLPQTWTSTMLRFYVEVFDYATDKCCTFEVAGYNYSGSGGSWVNVTAKMVGSPTAAKTVRFGHDGTKCCIYIGEVGSSWSYPKIRIADFTASYSNAELAKWDKGWSVSLVTSLGTISATVLAADVTPGGKLSGVDIITSSNASTYIAEAAIGAALIGSIQLVGNFSVKSAASGQRSELDAFGGRTYNASNVLVVRWGVW